MDLGPDAGVELYDFPTGRGFRALKPIQKGEIYLKVAWEKCWSADVARQRFEELGRLEGLASPDEDVMALHLLLERAKADSGWNAEHMRALPRTFDMLPHWSEAELAQLGEPDLQNTARRLQQQVRDDFNTLLRSAAAQGCEDLLKESGVDFDSYLWAKSVLWSRCVDFSKELVEAAGLPVKAGREHQRLLVPGFDMANHDPRLAGTGRTHTVLKDGSVALQASVDYAAGEEVCIFYERADNHRLLLWYGFVLPDNPFDAAQMRLPVPAQAGKRLEAAGAVMESANGQVYARCQMTLADPVPEVAILAAAFCQQTLPADSSEALTARQELESLRLLQKSIPKLQGSEPTLPSPTAWRRYCAAVVCSFTPRLQVVFHRTMEALIRTPRWEVTVEDVGLAGEHRMKILGPRMLHGKFESPTLNTEADHLPPAPNLLQSIARGCRDCGVPKGGKEHATASTQASPETQAAWEEPPVQVAPAARQNEMVQPNGPSRSWLRKSRKMRKGRV
ncbi:setd3 [Symbiodinium sp. CCMP2592]|nr:setd3 [Symbiodinium sp. CCMP2592]